MPQVEREVEREVRTLCRCKNGGVRSGSYFNGKPRGGCAACGRDRLNLPWHITPEHVREFLAMSTEGLPETDASRTALGHFGGRAISRATSDEATREYGLHGYLSRDLAGEPEDEQLDSSNYATMQWLKDRYEVATGVLDPVKAEESEMRLRALTVDTIRLFAAWEDYWTWRNGD